MQPQKLLCVSNNYLRVLLICRRVFNNQYVFMQVDINMGLHSYSQPSQSDDIFCNSEDGSFSEMEDLIRRDQAELSLHASSQVQYPPQPEVEFGIPQTCYCGAKPLLATSRTDPG